MYACNDIIQDTNLDYAGRRLLLRGNSANILPLNSRSSRNFDNSRNRNKKGRQSGLRNCFNGVLSHTLGAIGHYTNEFIYFSTYNTGKLFPKYENVNGILESNATISPSVSPTSAPTIFNNTKNSTAHRQGRIYDFEFAFDVGLLTLSDEILSDHKFKIVNVTLSGTTALHCCALIRYWNLRAMLNY